MKNNVIVSSLLLTLLVGSSLMSAGCGAGPQGNGNTTVKVVPTPTPVGPIDCQTASTAQIRTRIYEKLEENSTIKGQEYQFNISVAYVSARDKKVTGVGWSVDAPLIIDMANNIAQGCVTPDWSNFKTSASQLPPNLRVGCGSGTFACGDVCIPIGTDCKITGRTQ